MMGVLAGGLMPPHLYECRPGLGPLAARATGCGPAVPRGCGAGSSNEDLAEVGRGMELSSEGGPRKLPFLGACPPLGIPRWGSIPTPGHSAPPEVGGHPAG